MTQVLFELRLKLPFPEIPIEGIVSPLWAVASSFFAVNLIEQFDSVQENRCISRILIERHREICFIHPRIILWTIPFPLNQKLKPAVTLKVAGQSDIQEPLDDVEFVFVLF